MNKKTAIAMLNDLKNELNDPRLDRIYWIDRAMNSIGEIFGKSSDQYNQIADLTLETEYRQVDENIKVYNGIEQAKKYIDSYISHINNFGFPKMENNKEQFSISKKLFFSLIFPIVGGIFYFGYHVGNLKFDKEKIDYYNQMEIKQKTIDSLNIELKNVKTELDSIKKKKGSPQHAI